MPSERTSLLIDTLRWCLQLKDAVEWQWLFLTPFLLNSRASFIVLSWRPGSSSICLLLGFLPIGNAEVRFKCQSGLLSGGVSNIAFHCKQQNALGWPCDHVKHIFGFCHTWELFNNGGARHLLVNKRNQNKVSVLKALFMLPNAICS